MRPALVLACLTPLALAQGCGVFSIAMIVSADEGDEPTGPMRPVAVSALTAHPSADGGFEVTVLYEDGVLRRTSWQLDGAPAVWSQDRVAPASDPVAEDDFAQVEAHVAQGRWPQAVAGLDRLLRYGSDRVIQTEAGLAYVRDEARRRLRSLPAPGREAYALAHAVPAQRLLEAASRSLSTAPLERLLSDHPASPHVAYARRSLLARLVEAGRTPEALVHAEVLLEEAAPGTPQREEARRLRDRVASLVPEGARRSSFRRGLAPDRGWPSSLPVAAQGRDGLVHEHELLRLYGDDGTLLASLDLRRQARSQEPLTLAERGTRAAKALIWLLFFPVTVAADLATLPIQLTGAIIFVATS